MRIKLGIICEKCKCLGLTLQKLHIIKIQTFFPYSFLQKNQKSETHTRKAVSLRFQVDLGLYHQNKENEK